MFRKLHIQMTIFATLITSAILVLMTLACLYIAENGTRRNVYASFKNNINSCISHLETQTVISHQWILKAENAYGIKMDIKDNGKPLYFQPLNPSTEFQKPFEEAARISRDTYGIDPDSTGNISVLTKSAIFQMNDYYAATALIPKANGTLNVILLYPLDALARQIASQRISFTVAVFLAIAALGIFSWFFTKKMILPLEEIHRKQTEFIAAASHELRSPLAVILSGISALQTASPEDSPRFLSALHNEGTRMSRLVNDMLSLAETDSSFLISVQDNGPGIPDEKKKSIFERFYRADSARNDKQHFGLGLCIAHEIITLHKGEIRVSDAPEGGAIFTISLPK